MYSVDGRATFLALSIHHIVLDGPSQQVVYGHFTSILVARRGKEVATIPVHSALKIQQNAIAHHLNSLKARAKSELPAHVRHLQLPFERDSPSFGAFSTW